MAFRALHRENSFNFNAPSNGRTRRGKLQKQGSVLQDISNQSGPAQEPVKPSTERRKVRTNSQRTVKQTRTESKISHGSKKQKVQRISDSVVVPPLDRMSIDAAPSMANVEDIDTPDAHDPAYVSEYAQQIYVRLKQKEVRATDLTRRKSTWWTTT